MLARSFASQDHVLVPAQMADWAVEEPTQPPVTGDEPNPGGMIRIHYDDVPLVLDVIPSITGSTALVLLPASGFDDRQSPDEVPIDRLVIRNIPLGKDALEALLTLAGQELSGAAQPVDIHLSPASDVKQLLRVLNAPKDMPSQFAQLYARALCVAILTRISSCRVVKDGAKPRRKTAALPRWRLKRVMEYVNAHIGDPIRLADLANAAGLTRMHFAAQFRASVGMCPHEYLIRERLRRAQNLLHEPSRTLVDVALCVGFQTQAHFTAVFRRYIGDTPHRWRTEHCSMESREAEETFLQTSTGLGRPDCNASQFEMLDKAGDRARGNADEGRRLARLGDSFGNNRNAIQPAINLAAA
jgi:AraC-like DNA-binding protein